MAKSTKVVYVVVVTLTFIMAIYNIYTLLFTTYDIFAHMSMNLIFALPLASILHSGRKGAERISWYNIMLAIISIIPPLMLYLNYGEWVYGRFWFAASVQPIQIILGTIFLITIIELVRRYGGTILAILIIFFLIFLYIGPYIPYPFTHKGMSYERIIELNYITTYGTFITPLQVLSTYVIAFTILGAIFSYTGIGQYFIDLSKFLVGRMVGGPAKIATVASSLFGTISGSAVANVYGTGVITIPTMKGLGYPAAFAGATEAVASTGGQ
ncbi:MAG: TRAP transporter large permease subunit, partial [Nitrososphaerales archaeon]